MKFIRTATLALTICALGSLALQAQCCNNGYGDRSLGENTTGGFNNGFGDFTLGSNTTGSQNSAFGDGALLGSVPGTGSNNSAFGVESLYRLNYGSDNSAFGYNALYFTTNGYENTASGSESLYTNISGVQNTSDGYSALYSITGNYNTGIGAFALSPVKAGNYNIALGYAAGDYNSAGSSSNIDIGSWGSPGDNSAIRIGSGQTSFYVAGVNGVGVSGGIPVYINSNGQLGTINSSIRFKEDVHDMAAASDGLMRLRPVTYRYKEAFADGSKPVDYGLIAEEVAEVYPDLVVKNADGQIQTVQYQKLTPMLLNELQKQHKLLEQQKKTIEQQAKSSAEQAETIQQLQKQLAALPLLEKRLAALEAVLPSSTMLETRLVTR
ncbi:MAG: tail fiber domain-containing protein [Terracidiphilus sp.]